MQNISVLITLAFDWIKINMKEQKPFSTWNSVKSLGNKFHMRSSLTDFTFFYKPIF